MRDPITSLVQGVESALRSMVDSLDLRTLSGHNEGYERYAQDPFEHLIVSERARYDRVLRHLAGRPAGRAADLGCFIPYMPIALARLGHDVAAVDRFDLYDPQLRAAVAVLAEAEGFRMVELDVLTGNLGVLGPQDLVLLMAVVEHLNGSPGAMMAAILRLLDRGGLMIFEVPNIAELGRRIDLLRGRSPLPNYSTYLHSDYPFLGHNREMTVAEVKVLLTETGFVADLIDCFDYSPVERLSRRGRLVRAAKRLSLFDASRETILALARRAPTREGSS